MIVKHEGKILVVIAEPYITEREIGFIVADVYEGTAVDEEYEYRIIWEIINEETDDETEACDWEHPIEVKQLGRRFDIE